MNEKDHTERRYTEKEVSKTVEKVISEMLARGEIADTRAHNGSSAANVEVPTDALINLVNYQEQCDEDGVMVKVSRQALAEVLVYVQMVRLDLNRDEPQAAAVREALELAEDVLSRAPFSTAIWPNGMHPNRGIEKIRAALAQPSPAATVEGAEHIDWDAMAEERLGQRPTRSSARNAGVIRLLTKIADLVDNEDACEPLDDAIHYANEALAILNAAPADEVQRLRGVLESIADWRNVNISGEYEHGLRDIIRSIIDSAVAVLDEPKAPRSPSKPIPKPLHLIDDAGGGP